MANLEKIQNFVILGIIREKNDLNPLNRQKKILLKNFFWLAGGSTRTLIESCFSRFDFWTFFSNLVLVTYDSWLHTFPGCICFWKTDEIRRINLRARDVNSLAIFALSVKRREAKRSEAKRNFRFRLEFLKVFRFRFTFASLSLRIFKKCRCRFAFAQNKFRRFFSLFSLSLWANSKRISKENISIFRFFAFARANSERISSKDMTIFAGPGFLNKMAETALTRSQDSEFRQSWNPVPGWRHTTARQLQIFGERAS